MIEVQVDDSRVAAALAELVRRAHDLRPVQADLGEYFIESTKRRFATKTAPDGTQWKGNAQVTIDGKGRDDSLIGESRRLSNEIHYRIDGTRLSWGSSLVYAGMQQNGGLKAAYPHLWGDIPARPYLGLSGGDEQVLLEILQEHLAGAVN
ncbi:phage virion morphogenesis protein [Pseudomonas segetis]|uniref:Phage virion morphogenesis (Putative tail completion) protein n=1 Tax=Pseudomonas segetis TaxID=298908 RepID=A0A239JRZ7_9PSED|nr:phage virion morphogenesis protein [Pseudomonas segetis]SNT07544.1 phage virion morphogenesis (putative tail completion) protein [Pseudomonas segetis]